MSIRKKSFLKHKLTFLEAEILDEIIDNAALVETALVKLLGEKDNLALRKEIKEGTTLWVHQLIFLMGKFKNDSLGLTDLEK